MGKLARLLVALVLFFLLFGLPAMLGLQFMAAPAAVSSVPGTPPSRGLAASLRRAANFFSPGARPTAPASERAPGTSRPGAPPAEPGSSSAPAPDEAAAMAQAVAVAAAVAAGAPAAPAGAYGVMPEGYAEGGPIEEIRAARARPGVSYGALPSSPRAGSGGPVRAASAAKGADASGRRPMNSISGGAQQTSDDSLWAASRGRADKARLELNEELQAGPGHQAVQNAAVQGKQAVNMAKKLHLLDGAKDHAGKTFDGNWKMRKGIPLDKYTDSFGKQSIGVKGEHGLGQNQKKKDEATVDLR